jgi:hypothetical protein
VAGLLCVGLKDRYSERQLQFALTGAVALIVLLNVASSAFLFSALAPVKTMCGGPGCLRCRHAGDLPLAAVRRDR